MNAEIEALVRSAEKLAREGRAPEAFALLERELARDPRQPDLNTAWGLIACWTQREEEAVERLESGRGGHRWEELAQTLVDHFACKAQLARRLGKNAKAARASLRRVETIAGRGPGPVGVRLSACLIVRNEEANLPRCLKSLKGLVDEIVVVDTGSTDRTLSVAERFGARIGHFEWIDDFSAARNASLALATGDWILWIDADEEIAPGSERALQQALVRPQFAGYTVRIRNLLDGNEQSAYVHTAVRLFRRLPGVRFDGRIHEQVLPSILSLGLSTAKLDGFEILHYGYQPEVMRSLNKLDRTIRMLEREVADHPTDPFHLFNLGNAFAVAGRDEEAIPYLERCLEHLDRDAPYAEVAYHLLSSSYAGVGRYEDALAVCERADEAGFGGIVNEFDRALALSHLGRNEEALATIDRCLEMPWPSHLTGDYGIATFKRWLLKGQILGRMDRFEEALACFDRALEVDPDFPVTVHSKAVVLARIGRSEEAASLFLRCIDDSPQGLASALAAGHIRLEHRRFLEAAEIAERAYRLGHTDRELLDLWCTAARMSDDPATALRALEALAREDEIDPSGLVDWGRALARLGREEEALEKLRQASERAPDDANTWFNRGDLEYRLGDFLGAAQSYRRGLELSPESPEGWFVLGNSLAQLGIVEGALIAYDQALRLRPQFPEVRHNREVLLADREQAA